MRGRESLLQVIEGRFQSMSLSLTSDLIHVPEHSRFVIGELKKLSRFQRFLLNFP